MREKIKDYDRLLHILEAIDIGEASYMLTKEFVSSHPDTPWIDIIGMRHVLVHGYYTASPVFIYDTYKNDLGALKKQIESYISELR